MEKMQKQGPEKVPLWACTKSGPFSGDRTAKPKTAARFWFCISDIRLISERGRRRTDYLRGIRLSSVLHLFRHCIRMQPFMFRCRLPGRAGLLRTGVITAEKGPGLPGSLPAAPGCIICLFLTDRALYSISSTSSLVGITRSAPFLVVTMEAAALAKVSISVSSASLYSFQPCSST